MTSGQHLRTSNIQRSTSNGRMGENGREGATSNIEPRHSGASAQFIPLCGTSNAELGKNGESSQRTMEHQSHFTIIELVVAADILLAALGVTCALIGQSGDNVVRSREDWRLAHQLDLATEYFLLAKPGVTELPSEFRVDGMTATCRIRLLDADAAPVNGWTLAAYDIRILSSSDSRELCRHTVQQMVRRREVPDER